MINWFCRHKWKRTGMVELIISNITNRRVGHVVEQECERCGKIQHVRFRL